MSDQDKAIIWRYRYSLIDNGRALGKFLQSARFQVETELKEAMRIFKRWSQIELEDALPLLSIKFAANAIYKEEV
jgi:phosphatidylinositol 3-kinase